MMPTPDHAAVQASLAAALLSRNAAMPDLPGMLATGRLRSALAVHRNNIAASLLEVIASRFPVVRRFAGDPAFFDVARAFLTAHPPRSPVLMEYGGEFSTFVRRAGSSAHFIADIADLELTRARAWYAADAAPVPRTAFEAIPADALGKLRLELHPSTSIVASRYPIVSAWRALHENDNDELAFPAGAGETALVARPFLEVEVQALPAGGGAFVEALAGGRTMAEALTAGAAEVPAFDLPANLAALLSANIVTAIRFG